LTGWILKASSTFWIVQLYARNYITRLRTRIPLTNLFEATPLHVPWNFIFRGDATDIPEPTGTLNDYLHLQPIFH
jgi:hypothetical protein